jgi:hypothetical protein
MSEPDDALHALAALLRADDSVVSARVGEPAAEPALGRLVAAGPRTDGAPGEYALVVEAVREGYLLHYDQPAARLVRDADPDLALLAGDYLYALGLERLAALGDLEAVAELSDLISLVAQIHDGSRPAERAANEARALWLGSATAIAAGRSPAHEEAKAGLRAGDEAAAAALRSAATAEAATAGLGERLRLAAAQLDLPTHHPSSLG